MDTSPGPVDWNRLARLAPRAALAGVLFGWVLAFVVDSGDGQAASWGGDYPAFQMAGKILLQGNAEHLYDLPTQRAAEAGMPVDGFLAFYYPPFVAALYAPLAAFPYRVSYALFTLLSLAALGASVRLLAPCSALIRADPWRAFAAVLLFYPVLRSTFGGQNTALSLLIICATWRLLGHRRDLLAGIVLGLLSYKPQFLLPIAGVVFLAGRYQLAVGVTLTAAALYAAGVSLMGWDWPQEWWQFASSLSELDYVGNAYNSVSLAEIPRLFGWSKGWVVVSGLLSLGVALIASTRGRADLFGVLAIALATCLLIPPHALYYDVGITLPAMMLLADRGRPVAAAALWLAAASQMLAPPLPLSPVIAVLVAMFVLLRSELGK